METELTSPTTLTDIDDVLSGQADDNDFKPSITIKHFENANPQSSSTTKRIRKSSSQTFLTFCNISVFLFSFAVLIAIMCLITVPNQYAKDIKSLDLMSARNNVIATYITLRDLIRLAIENQGGYYVYTGLYYYAAYRDYLNTTIYDMSKFFPEDFIHPLLEREMASFPIFEKRWGEMIVKTCSLVYSNGTLVGVYLNRTLQQEARDELYSSGYSKDFNDFQNMLFDYLDSASRFTAKADYLRKDSLIASISLICLTFVVLVPTIIILLIMAIRNEKQNKKHFHHANNRLMNDTMGDESARMKFQIACQNSNLLNEFLLLERIQLYKEYSNESLNMQMKLYEIANQFVENKLESEKFSSITKACNEIEKVISYFERMKYETVVEIMDIYDISAEDSRILDMYNNSEDVFEEIDLLPPSLFQKLGKDLTETLAETHIHYLENKGDGKMIDLEDVQIQHQTSI